MLRRGEHTLPPGLIRQDFWVVDDDTVITMIYDEHGGFTAAEIQPDSSVSAYRATRAEAWAAAEPFTAWWARHPELHRRATA